MKNNCDQPSWESFVQLCARTSSEKDLERLFDLFLTLEEKKAITGRYKIVVAFLEKKLTQREMAEKLQVSIAKITRGSNNVKRLDDRLRQVIEANM